MIDINAVVLDGWKIVRKWRCASEKHIHEFVLTFITLHYRISVRVGILDNIEYWLNNVMKYCEITMFHNLCDFFFFHLIEFCFELKMFFSLAHLYVYKQDHKKRYQTILFRFFPLIILMLRRSGDWEREKEEHYCEWG